LDGFPFRTVQRIAFVSEHSRDALAASAQTGVGYSFLSRWLFFESQ